MSNGGQLFITDTECFLSLRDHDYFIRPTIEEFHKLIDLGAADFLGQHIVGGHGEAGTNESEVRNIPVGRIIWDVEWCEFTEFYFEYCSESKKIDRDGNIL